MYGSPQRKSRLEAAGAPTGSGGLGLPDEMLLAVFARLTLEERWESPPRPAPCLPVSRRLPVAGV